MTGMEMPCSCRTWTAQSDSAPNESFVHVPGRRRKTICKSLEMVKGADAPIAVATSCLFRKHATHTL